MERRLSLDLSLSGLFPPTLVPHLNGATFIVAALRSSFSVVLDSVERVGQKLLIEFPRTWNFVVNSIAIPRESRGGKELCVHCSRGVTRSPALPIHHPQIDVSSGHSEFMSNPRGFYY